MKLAPRTNEIIESFFRHYFGEENLKLPKIQVYFGSVSKLVTNLLNIDGITIGRHILIRPSLIYRNSDNQICLSKKLLVHEITHVLQYQKEGFFGFLFNYFNEYFKNIKRRKNWNSNSRMYAYLDIPHEIEARDSASKFINWFSSLKS